MEKPIRYYITTSGEEPTVRSVTVARDSPELDDRSDSDALSPIETTAAAHERQRSTATVRRLVKGAIRRRPPEA